MAKGLSIFFGVLIALLLALYLLLPRILDKDRVVELAANAVKEETGATLTVDGDLELSFFPVVGVAFNDAAITMPEKTQPDLEVAAAQIGVRLAPLFSGRVEVDSITVDGITARTESAPEEKAVDTSGFSDAELDAWYAARREEKQQAGEAAGAAAALAVPLALSVSSLKVTNARVESLDPATDTTTVIDIKELDASGLNLNGEPIPLAVKLQIPGEQAVDIDVAGDLRVNQQDETVAFEQLAIKVIGATPEPLAIIATGSAHIARQTADVALKLNMSELTGDGTVRYASFESPQIDANLKLNLLDPVLFALAGPEAAASAESAPSSGDEPLPLDALRAVDTRATLQVATARFGAHEVTDVVAKLRAVEGVINLSELTGEVYGGALNANANFNGRHNTATLQTRGDVQNLDLAQALAASGSADLLSGGASLSWQLSSSGKTANELTGALQGPIQLQTSDIVLHGTSVDKMLCTAVALTNQEPLSAGFSPDTRFKEVSAQVQVTDGKAVLRPLTADLAHVSLNGTGDLDLLSQDFQAVFKARLSPGMEELDPACRVSKRLTAIDFPVKCQGNTATEPASWCGVDSEKIVRDLAVNEGRRKLEKKAGKLMDKLFNNK